jgi:hypothetical protein
VLIGCGFANYVACRNLIDFFDITIIDKKKSFHYNLVFHKLILDPKYIEKLEIDFVDAFPTCTFINELVREISPTSVVLKNSVVHFDYLIVGTGSYYKIPFPINNQYLEMNHFYDDGERSENAYIINPTNPFSILDSYQKIRESNIITVIGIIKQN